MLTDTIRDYYGYTQWANQKVLDQAQLLTEEKFLATDLDNVWPIRDTLVHIMGAQALWLDRWRGVAGSTLWDPRQFPDVDTIRERWRVVDEETEAFLAGLTDERLAADLSYAGGDGRLFTRPLWKQMLHQANHATYHRGEVAALLSRYGLSPGEIDYLRFEDAKKG